MVDGSIQFNHQASRMTIKINDKSINHLLAAKMQTKQPPRT